MKSWILLFFTFASSALYAMPCSETPESTKAMQDEIQKIGDLDKKGEAQFRAALNDLQKASKKDDKQLAVYAAQVATKPELAPLQQDRQALGLRMMTLLSGNDCEAFKDNNKKLRTAVATQWIGVLTAVQADTQVYLARNMGDAPDIRATTDSGRKVILHSNGTWTEESKK